MIPLLIAGLAAALVVSALLRRAPVTTLCAIGLLGVAFHTGILRLPSALTGPVVRADAALRRWQQRQTAALACDIAANNALAGSEDVHGVTVDQACGGAGQTADLPVAAGP